MEKHIQNYKTMMMSIHGRFNESSIISNKEWVEYMKALLRDQKITPEEFDTAKDKFKPDNSMLELTQKHMIRMKEMGMAFPETPQAPEVPEPKISLEEVVTTLAEEATEIVEEVAEAVENITEELFDVVEKVKKSYYHNPDLKKSKLITPDEEDEYMNNGWRKGRLPKV